MKDTNNIETLILGDGKYYIKYIKNKEYIYHVYRYDEDITESVVNNVFSTMFYDLLKAKNLF